VLVGVGPRAWKSQLPLTQHATQNGVLVESHGTDLEVVIVKDLRTNVARAITQSIRALLIVIFSFIFIISRPIVVFNVFIVVSK
jgi:hypothetical protein